MFTRNETREVNIGGVKIGAGNRIAVQSMTNTDTRDADATIRQIRLLEEEGCDIIRVAVPDETAARAVEKIKRGISIPLVVDIHFDYKLALICAENGADKIRINPGNIGVEEHTRAVVEKCKACKIPIRIGINGGSLEKSLVAKYGGPTAEAVVESAMGHVKILENMDFDDIVVSLKTTDVKTAIESYRLMAQMRNYPLHVGVTEAGTIWGGTIKSAAGIGAILASDIGDTIRVSLTGDPCEEVRVGKKILQSLGLGSKKIIDFVSCPTCGRTCVDLIGTAGAVEAELSRIEAHGGLKKPLKVAIMGCAVNGPGEARDADIGMAGGKNEFLIFEKGEIVGKVPEEIAKEVFVKRVVELSNS